MPPSADPPSTACFFVQAVAEPSLMPRVLEVFARRGLVPTRWHSTVAGRHGDELHIDIQVPSLGPDLSAYIARCLAQIVHVERVLTSEKRHGAARLSR